MAASTLGLTDNVVQGLAALGTTYASDQLQDCIPPPPPPPPSLSLLHSCSHSHSQVLALAVMLMLQRPSDARASSLQPKQYGSRH